MFFFSVFIEDTCILEGRKLEGGGGNRAFSRCGRHNLIKMEEECSLGKGKVRIFAEEIIKRKRIKWR